MTIISTAHVTQRAQILTLKSTTSDFRKSGQRLAAHCRYTRVYLLTVTAEAEADGLFTMSESFQDNRLYLADVIPASRCYSRPRSSTPAG